jgi:hypothetical protein
LRCIINSAEQDAIQSRKDEKENPFAQRPDLHSELTTEKAPRNMQKMKKTLFAKRMQHSRGEIACI